MARVTTRAYSYYTTIMHNRIE